MYNIFACHIKRFDHSSSVRDMNAGLFPGLRLANERRRYKVTLPLIGWAQV